MIRVPTVLWRFQGRAGRCDLIETADEATLLACRLTDKTPEQNYCIEKNPFFCLKRVGASEASLDTPTYTHPIASERAAGGS